MKEDLESLLSQLENTSDVKLMGPILIKIRQLDQGMSKFREYYEKLDANKQRQVVKAMLFLSTEDMLLPKSSLLSKLYKKAREYYPKENKKSIKEEKKLEKAIKTINKNILKTFRAYNNNKISYKTLELKFKKIKEKVEEYNTRKFPGKFDLYLEEFQVFRMFILSSSRKAKKLAKKIVEDYSAP